MKPSLAVLALLLGLQASLGAEGKLKQAADQLQGGAPQPQTPTAAAAPSSDANEACLSGCLNSFLYLFVAPASLAGDEWKEHRPYRPGSELNPDMALKVQVDASYYQALKIATTGFELSWLRLELRALASRLEEWPAEGPRDFMHAAKADLQLRFVNTQHFRSRAGIGARGLFDANRGISLGGGNFLYGMEFSAGPMVARLDGELGGLGGQAVLEGRATLGFLAGPLEIFGGYQNLDIAGVGLGGPLAGLKGWF